MDDCLFCGVRDGRIPAKITHRDADVIAFADIKPVAPFHQLVIPTQHIGALAEASAADAVLLGRLMLVGAALAKAAGLAAGGFRVVMNNGADAGQTVAHVHLHVLAGRSLGWPPG